MKEKREIKTKLKYYHIIFLSILLCPFIIINSNSVNNQRNIEKLNQEKKEKFERILAGRKLNEGDDDTFPEDTNKICEKGSDEQKEYYKTGDGTKVGIKDGEISSEDRPEYIQALIDIIKGSSSEGESIDVKEKLTPYLKHLFPVFFFLAVTVLSIPGWIMCCSCCCSNCCCCYCLKKLCCKLPFLIITYACYAIVFVVCIYGLSKSNNIFVGLADTECSLLRFVGDVVYGETKDGTKWGGVKTITNKLSRTSSQLDYIEHNLMGDLESNKNSVGEQKALLKTELKTQSTKVKGIGVPYDYDNSRLDLAFDFGEFDANDKPTFPSFVYNWTVEYEKIADTAEKNMSTATDNFGILTTGGMKGSLENAKGPIEQMQISIDNVKDQISDIIINYSDTIDKYGKLGFKIVFSILTVFVAAIAAVMSLLFFCSGKKCSSCCLFRCGFKIILHILWNILAFLMILTFLTGSIFVFVGTIGKDLVSVVSFVVSSENLEKSKNEIALLGEAADTLIVCLNGDGDITEKIGINKNEMDKIDELKFIENTIDELIYNFTKITSQKVTYNNYKKKLDDRKSYSTYDYGFKDNVRTYKYNLQKSLNAINNEITQYEKIDFKCIKSDPNTLDCSNQFSTTQTFKCIDLTEGNCKITAQSDNSPIKGRYYSSAESSQNLKDAAEINGPIINYIILAQEFADKENIDGSIRNAIEKINEKYDDFLETEISGLRVFKNAIHGLTVIFEDLIGKKDKFSSFLNCKFMGKNIKVVLKFLEKCLGDNFYTVGVCLLLAGCSLAVAISFTILLIAIINDSVKKK